MKKFKLSILLVLSLMFVMVGCGEVSGEKSPPKEDPAKQEDTETEPVEKEEPATEEFATRKNPATFGETVMASGDYIGTPVEYELTLRDLIRGEEAEKIALEMNQFNEWGENEEPILFTVDFNLTKYAPEDDEPYFVDGTFSFSTFESSYAQFNSENYVTVEGEFGGKVYEGGNITGIVGKIVPKGDKSLIVFEDSFWFQLP